MADEAGEIDDDGPVWLDLFGFLLVVVVSLLSGIAAVAIETARVGADYYDGGNNFANGVAIVFIPMIVLPIAIIVFVAARVWRRPWWLAAGCALAPTLCILIAAAFWPVPQT